MKADVPLQKRNEAFAATQANPTTEPGREELSLTEDYGNEFFNPTQYNDLFSQYLFTFWASIRIIALPGTGNSYQPHSGFFV